MAELHTLSRAKGRDAYLRASEAVERLKGPGHEDELLLRELENALALYEMMPAALRRRWRQRRDAQEELACRTACRLSLRRLQHAVTAYRSAPSKRTAPVVLEIFRTFCLVRSFPRGRIPVPDIWTALESMDAQLMASPSGRSVTARQEALHRLFSLLLRHMPTDGNQPAREEGAPSRAESALRSDWKAIRRAKLLAPVREASMAMLGLTALDIICQTDEDGADPALLYSISEFGIAMLQGNGLVDGETVGNLYLIGAYYLDRLSRAQDCVRWLREGGRRIGGARADLLRIDEIVYAIQGG